MLPRSIGHSLWVVLIAMKIVMTSFNILFWLFITLFEVSFQTWKTIFQFANAVAGHAQSNWQVKDGSLGFSRGQKGFFAMGNLNNVNFYTGLPDGDYCDIIHECQQKITISNGFGIFNKAKDNDPVVAICVGCS